MKPNDRGMTLVELIVVIVVLAVAAIPISRLLFFPMTHSADPGAMITAAQLAQEKLEIVIGDRANPGRGFAWIATAAYPAETPVAGFAAYNRDTSVEYVNDPALDTPVSPGPTSYKRVTVNVVWSGGNSITARTLVADY